MSRRRKHAAPKSARHRGLLTLVGRLALAQWPLTLLAVLLVAGGWGAWSYAHEAPEFLLREVRVPVVPPMRLPEGLEGRNIFTVNLKTLRQSIVQLNPQVRQVRVLRILPSALMVEAVERRPVAQVHLNRYYGVDLDGFVEAQGQPQPYPLLPVLEGVEEHGADIVPGRRNDIERLLTALGCLNQFQSSAALQGHHVTMVDVADPEGMVFMLDGAVEVRLGSAQQLEQKLRRLQAVLRTVEVKRLRPSYLDLRFDDPIIGP